MFGANRRSSLAAFCLSLLCTLSTASAVDLDASHLAVPGDFNADGRLDVLLQPLTTADQGSIVLQDGTGELSIVAQGWNPGYLGLDWSTAGSTLTAADLNGDGQDDVLMQPVKSGQPAAVLVMDPSVQLLQVTQLIPANYLGLDWSSTSHVAVTGDFDGDHHKELLLQAVKRGGLGALVHADAAGHLVLVMQDFADGFLHRHWNASDENLYVGDFNGDGRQDLLVQSRRIVRGESAYALLLADGDGRFSHIAETWNLHDLGADWNPATHQILIEDANGDGIADITLRSTQGGTNYLFEGNAQGRLTQPSARWTGNQSAKDALAAQNGTQANNGISVSMGPQGPTAQTISAPTNPEQNPTVARGTSGAQGSAQIMTANAAGVLQGSAGVSGGTATYSIPIAVPPGIAGMQPSVSLNYSSRGGNGEAGMGWSLSAGSQIHRCPATKAMDGYTSGVTYGPLDRLCLDGQHLILAADSTVGYGLNGAKYRTELQSFVRITETGDMSDPTSHFTVEQKGGRTLGYGNTSGINAVFTASGISVPLAWGLAIELDTYNNSVIYNYSTFGAGEHLLTSIKYTGTGAAPGNREVDFTYQPRSDVSYQYLAGGLTQQTQLLSSITTLQKGNLVRTYSLEYSSSSATNRSLLAGVQECGGSGASQACLPETTFSWHAPTTAFNPASKVDDDLNFNLNTPSGIVAYAGGDFDGDGRKELIYSAPGVKETVYFLNANGTVRHSTDVTNVNSVPATYLFGINGGLVDDSGADLNNDGAADLLGFVTGTGGAQWLAYSTYDAGAGTFRAPVNLGISATNTVQGVPFSSFVTAADVNGDGMADIVVVMADPINPGYHMLGAYLNQTMTCSPRPGCNNTASFASTAVRLKSVPDYTDTVGTLHFIDAKPAGDVDGNGLPDFELSYYDTSGTWHDGWIFLAEDSQGNLSAPFPLKEKSAQGVAPAALDGNLHPRMLDINGDGLQDIVYDCSTQNTDWCYQLNQGGTFAHYVDSHVADPEWGTLGDESGLIAADIDNDGAQELLDHTVKIADFCQHYTNYTQEGTTGPADVCGDPADDSNATKALPPGQDDSIYWYNRYKFVPQADSTAEDLSGYRYVPQAASTGIIAQAHTAVPMDLQGDGLTAIVSSFTIGGKGNFFVQKTQTGFPNGPGLASNGEESSTSLNAAPDLMTAAVDGFGHQDQWDYYPLASGVKFNNVALYYSPASNGGYAGDDYFYFSSSMYVVGEYRASNGIGGMNGHDFHYAQAIYNSQGRGFQGFRLVAEDDNASGARTVQYYHQRFPLSGLLEQSWVTSISSAHAFDITAPNPIAGVIDPDAVDHVTNTAACYVGPTSRHFSNGTFTVDPVNDPVTCSQTFDSAAYWGFVQSGVEHKQDLNNSHRVADTTVNHSYDKFGNETQTSTSTTDDYGTYTQNVTNTFDTTDTADWWIDKLQTKQVVTDAVYSNVDAGSKTRTTNYDYDTVANGRGLTFVHALADGDPKNKVDTQYQYLRGNVQSVTVTGGTGTVGVGTAIASRTTTTDYDTSSADAYYFPIAVTDPLGHKTLTSIGSRFGLPNSVTDPNGVVTTYTYDVFGRKTSVQVGSLPAQTIQYITHVDGDGMCDGIGSVATYYMLVNQDGAPSHFTCYDPLGRPTRNATEGFATGGDPVYVTTDYDARGRVLRTTEPHFANDPYVWNNNSWSSDILGRLNSISNAKGVITSYAYDGPITTITTKMAAAPTDASTVVDASYLRTDQEVKNALGKLMTVTNAVGAPEQAATSYAYDSDGNPVTITAADGSQIVAVYNILGQKTDVTDPDQGHTSYTYDVLGELLTQTDAKGQTQTMSYDTGGRMLTKVTPEGTSTWCYDGETFSGTAGSCTGTPGAHALGKVSAVAQGDGTAYQESYTYDSLSRISRERNTIDGVNYDTDTSYDADGRVDTVTYPASITDAAPVANAGAAQYVAKGATVTLNGSATDSDGPGALHYQWTQTSGPAIALSDVTVANPTFIAGTTPGTSYTFQLVADDGFVQGAPATVTVNVPNLPAVPAGLTDTGDTDHDGTYTVSWNTVTPPTGTTIKYHLEEAGGTSSGPTASWTEIYAGSTASTSVSHPGNGFYYYYYRVRAEDLVGTSSIGFSGYSATDSIHVVVTPGMPASITPQGISSSSTGSYTISWGAYTGSLPASKVFYELYEASSSAFSPQSLVYSGANRSKAITQTSLGDYYYHVRACNQDGTLKECSGYQGNSHIIVTGTGGGGGQQQVQQAPSGSTTLAPIGSTSAAIVPAAGLPQFPVDGSRNETAGPSDDLIASLGPMPTSHLRLIGAPEFAPPLYKAWADAHLQSATGGGSTVRLAVQYQYTAHGYLWKLKNAVNPNLVYWNINAGFTGNDTYGDYYQSGMDAHGNPVDVYFAGGTIETRYKFGGNSGYLAAISSSNGGTNYQSMGYTWLATGNLQSRSNQVTDAGVTYNPSETFSYDLHNRLVSSTVTNNAGTQTVTYSYDNVGNLRCKSDVVGHTCDNSSADYSYGQGGALPHAVTAIAGAGTYVYDANGNMINRNGTTVAWNSDNMPVNITQDANNNSAFSYAPDKHRYKQVAMNAGVQETTLYAGGLEIFTSGGTTHYKHILTAYGRPVILDELKNTTTSAVEIKSAVLTDHLGSVDTVVDLSSASPLRQSFTAFGRHRDPDHWTTQAANTATLTKRGFTDHEHLDQLALIHMNGRVMDPTIGRFLSVDPIFQAPTNTQSVNPYSYVMNNPLSLVDPSGYAAACTPDSTGSTASCTASISDMKPGDSKTATITTTTSSTGSHIDSHSTVTGTVTMNKDGSVSVKIDSPNGSSSGSTGTSMPSITNAGGSGNQGSPSQRQSGLSVSWSDGCSANQHAFNMPDAPPPGSTSVWEQGWSDIVTLDGNYKPHGGPNSISQIAGIVYHETRGMDDHPLENRSLDAAKGNIAHVRLNGLAKWGSKIDGYAGMASPIVNGSDEYQNDYMITIRAVAEDLHGIDPTHGSILYNMRTDNQDFAGRPFYGQPVRTQSGPYDSPTKYDYIETYGPKPPP